MDVVLAVLPRCLTMAAVYCQAIIPFSLDMLRMYAAGREGGLLTRSSLILVFCCYSGRLGY